MQSPKDPVSRELVAQSDPESEDSRLWYVRLRIRDDRLAKIWAWNLAEHDAIVWSDAEERWKQLLAVPELRTAVRKATTSAFARTRTASEPPPNALVPSKQPTLIDIEFEDTPKRRERSPKQAASREDNEPTRVRQRPSSGIPIHVDPFLQALTTSIPPAVLTNPPPDIPRAPRLPNFAEPNDLPAPAMLVQNPGNVAVGFASRHQRAFRRLENAVTGTNARNIGWALLPVVCAAVFAIVLFRGSDSGRGGGVNAASVTSDATYLDWLLDERALTEKLATKLVGAGPVCSGQTQVNEAPSIISPEQLRLISSQDRKEGPRAVRPKSTGVAALHNQLSEKASAQSPKSGALASAADSNEFDREAARTALRFAIARARNCSNAGVSGSVLVTFAPGGTVHGVQIAQLVGDDVDPSCVTRAFSVSRVPPFTGSAVTVRKSF
jgi:hypothetical protein